ncbi:hypothetical protein [Legionella spiritensis]|uniref:Lipase n=1 Tax=Legionella spiritensis TaxID=452 RepID=A0A0W0Z8N4_LEGSP|nr:hypothetical protein [Legionella spiritensis]KTD65483.1 hypothetical protein Lspi_0557 [Legionella spiritensis]SNV35867.1 Uncharacterised protein [Legionella spiritensis]VEG89872.1 Uncharacterised protein [Legionella spiritensis]
MDLTRFIFCLLCLFFSSLGLAGHNQYHTGIALIHGTNDHRHDAVGGYWKKDFVDYMADSLPDPENIHVVACNYGHYMWHEDAAGCTADQLLAFIDNKEIKNLIVYTHSDGANVIRWILSNPTYDPRYFRLSKVISQVIAIAPSSGGTPLSDEVMNGNLFEEALGWLLGYRNDAIKQQRIGDMAIYNDELLYGSTGRLSLAVPFRNIIGSDVHASPLSGASYCNGYMLNAALKITKIYLDKCSDGFLDCKSQTAAGDVWFFDTDKTKDGETLSHNQSRHSCLGLGDILRQDLMAQGVAK